MKHCTRVIRLSGHWPEQVIEAQVDKVQADIPWCILWNMVMIHSHLDKWLIPQLRVDSKYELICMSSLLLLTRQRQYAYAHEQMVIHRLTKEKSKKQIQAEGSVWLHTSSLSYSVQTTIIYYQPARKKKEKTKNNSPIRPAPGRAIRSRTQYWIKPPQTGEGLNVSNIGAYLISPSNWT